MHTSNDPEIADTPPAGDEITSYDRAHLTLYLRLLDADAAGASVDDVAPVLLGIDASAEPDRAQRVHAAHLDRARWMAAKGYRQIPSDAD